MKLGEDLYYRDSDGRWIATTIIDVKATLAHFRVGNKIYCARLDQLDHGQAFSVRKRNRVFSRSLVENVFTFDGMCAERDREELIRCAFNEDPSSQYAEARHLRGGL
jgi:hypothetical protein